MNEINELINIWRYSNICDTDKLKEELNAIAIPKKVLDKILTPQLFHDIYEQEARKSGWETHKNCINKKFDDLPETNQEAMINTIRRIKELLAEEEKE